MLTATPMQNPRPLPLAGATDQPVLVLLCIKLRD